ncbi:MAG TPA: ABC transporter substrate-binding protein [Methylomirabilota bacterium]|nr:ABC transporter substrate-binding protein [Methylomirabilota bacterium]
MNRRAFFSALSGSLLAAPLTVEAQQPGKVYHVGVLTNNASDSPEVRLWQAFRSGLRERGWIEGQNIVIELREAEGNVARLPKLAADLVRLKVDLILARASTFVQAARAATSSIPIVFVAHADPVGAGHVASLARPGGNITGLAMLMTDLAPKYLELLISAVPMAKRIAVLWSPETPSHAMALKALEKAGRTLPVQQQPVGVRTAAELEGAFAAMARARAQAVLVLIGPIFLAERQRVAELAMKHRLPTISTLKEVPEAGGLMSYGPNQEDLYRRGAIYVDRILRGARPADLPVEQATKFELIVNLKTAKALGLTIPPSLLQRADQVIE